MTTTDSSQWFVDEPRAGSRILLEFEGLVIDSNVSETGTNVAFGPPRNRLGRLLPSLVPQLLELDLARIEDGCVVIDYATLASLPTHGIDAFDDLAPWAPFTLEIESTGSLGTPDFAYRCRFYSGRDPAYLERRGCFVKHRDRIYRLDSQTFALVEAIDAFNSRPDESKASLDAFVAFANVKGLAQGVGAQLDRYVLGERIVISPRVALDLVVEDGGRISFAPRIDGVDTDRLREAFLGQDDVDAVYSLAAEDGARVRVILDDEQREVLRRMQRVRHLGGAERAEILRNPTAVFDGVASAVDIDADSFGPRVRGIGDFPFVAQPYLKRGTGIFDGPEGEGPEGPVGAGEPVAGIRCSYADGREEDLVFTTRDEIVALHDKVQEARRSGEGTVDFRDKSIVLDPSFVGAMDELREQVAPRARIGRDPKQRRFLLIYTNEESVEYQEEAESAAAGWTWELPRAYAPGISPKQHQLEGIGWLQRCFLAGRKGTLLADDMGMGKTFQILSFLAWLIERGEIAAGPDPNRPPWKPILIVAPLVLIDNATWTREMARFFPHDGALFRPWTVLRGEELKKLRRTPTPGKETDLGESVLDLDRLCENRVLITNYDTITNYQYSFARLKDRLSVIVTDEAQAYKIPSTKISHALKSLSPRFRVACTGTPVETRLLDVWNLFDFLQPGQLLGSASEFSRRFERGGAVTPESVAALKERLRFGAPDAFVLRRDKTGLKDLPARYEHELACPLSERQRQIHVDLQRRVRGGEHPLGIIQTLLQLYQHPALVPRYEPTSPQEAIDACPKLQTVLHCLENVRQRGEKALIFTRTLDMQALLADVLRFAFGLEPGIVNGASGSRSGGGRGAILQLFRESRGFDAIILSPDVAGLGLTLTEANHVIHYGRWWNPAKEAQATDRAYRIGQEKDVHVYYPVAHDPRRDGDAAQAFETFDEKLHALLQRRRELAQEFLAPVAQEDDLQQELIDGFASAELPCDTEPAPSPPVVVRTSWLPWKKAAPVAWETATFAAALVQAEEKAGARVLRAPLAGCDGLDLVSIRADGVRLVRMMTAEAAAGLDANALAGTRGNLEAFRARHLSATADVRVEYVLGLATTAEGRLAKAAQAAGMVLADVGALVRPSEGEVVAFEATHERLPTLADLAAAVESEVRRRFPQAASARPAVADPPWLEALCGAPAFVGAMEAAGRARLPEERVREAVRALAERGYRCTTDAFLQRLALPSTRGRSVMTALQRLLNLDGYPVFAFDDERGTVELNVELLRKQFGLGSEG